MNPEPFPAESRSKEPLIDITVEQYEQLMESRRGPPKSTKNREQRRRDARKKK